jgi:hypothetical protein
MRELPGFSRLEFTAPGRPVPESKKKNEDDGTNPEQQTK